MGDRIDIKKYDKMLYKSSLVDVDSYVIEKQDKVHEQLLMAALEKAFDSIKHLYKHKLAQDFGLEEEEVLRMQLEEFLGEYRMKELKAEEYFMPSKVLFKRKKFPYDEYEVHLDNFWDGYPATTISKGVGSKLSAITPEDDMKIVYIDYVNGKTKLKSKMTGDEVWVPSEYVTEDITLHDEFTLNGTFQEMLKNSVD